MSKYDEDFDEDFVTMKSCIFFTIVVFIQSIICSELTNLTQDDADFVCPISFFRRKRAVAEYTRWRASEESTPQFIVKVLDEDITPPSNKKIVAVNILPVTKGIEKIIIGGAMVPSPKTTVTTFDIAREYTRFVPPTTMPVTRLEDLFLAPVPTPEKRQTFLQKGRHSLRDESPPASPQFLARTPAFRQYAPIAAVAFTRRATVSPITPSTSMEGQDLRTASSPLPTRTSKLPDISIPTRTEQPVDEYSYADGNLIFMTRTTFKPTYSPVRTTPENAINDEDSRVPTQTTFYDVEKRRNLFKNKPDIDLDASYNMLFYDEDSDVTSRRSKDTDYDDRSKMSDEQKYLDLNEAAAMSGMEEETEVNEVTDINTTEFESKLDNNDETSENITIGEKILIKELKKIDLFKSNKTIRKSCNLVKLRMLTFDSPRTLPEIVAQLKRWSEESPVAKLIDITQGNYTTLENPIHMMIVDDPTSGQAVSAKQTVMIVAGIQGRDHHAVAAAMYVLYHLIERTSAHSDLLTSYRFWIIPVFNPDGYDYSMTFPHRREWTKNLRQNWESCKERESCKACESLGLRCTVQPCYGVNLDRNFEYQWIPTEELRSEHPCGSLYAGTRQLSEPETRALTQYLHHQRVPLYTFIALKEGDVLGILYPYSHTKKKRAFDIVHRQRASRAAAAAYSIAGRNYVAGQTSENLPLYAGGIEDWIDGHLGVDNTYTIMMFRPSESYSSKLITERVVHEAFAAMDTLLLQSVEREGGALVGVSDVTLKSQNVATQRINTSLMIIMNIVFQCLR